MIAIAIITALVNLLPIVDMHFKMNLLVLINALMDTSILVLISQYFNYFTKRKVVICSRDAEGNHNSLFTHMEKYLINKFSDDIPTLQLHIKNGNTEFILTNMLTGKKYIDVYTLDDRTHFIYITIVADKCTQICLESKTLNSNQIKDYVSKIITIRQDIMVNNQIVIYIPIIVGKKKDEQRIEWDCIRCKTNKTLLNTIYSQDVIKELFNDIDKFINNEKFYVKRGIPYKRGYFLHSTPGQGKTSVSKIIANMYNMPIFSLDLSIIKDNSTLAEMMISINEYSNGRNYVLLIEDIDRSKYFKRRDDSELTLDVFLNALDGVNEANGRILIMTANDPYDIINNTALIRPGRVDKIVEMHNCDIDQITRMYNLFYEPETPINTSTWNLKNNLSAAYIIKLLQENYENPADFVKKICSDKKLYTDEELGESELVNGRSRLIMRFNQPTRIIKWLRKKIRWLNKYVKPDAIEKKKALIIKLEASIKKKKELLLKRKQAKLEKKKKLADKKKKKEAKLKKHPTKKSVQKLAIMLDKYNIISDAKPIVHDGPIVANCITELVEEGEGTFIIRDVAPTHNQPIKFATYMQEEIDTPEFLENSIGVNDIVQEESEDEQSDDAEPIDEEEFTDEIDHIAEKEVTALITEQVQMHNQLAEEKRERRVQRRVLRGK